MGFPQRENTAMLYEKFPDDAHLSKTVCLQAAKQIFCGWQTVITRLGALLEERAMPT